jgi:hypothetical protein
MDFRAVTLIALWTLISGPILGVPTGPSSSKAKSAPKVVRLADAKPAPHR